MKLHQFDWFELTTRLFHLQMNTFIIIFDKLWGNSENIASLNWYTGVLKQPKISKNMKIFMHITGFSNIWLIHMWLNFLEKRVIRKVLISSRLRLPNLINIALSNKYTYSTWSSTIFKRLGLKLKKKSKLKSLLLSVIEKKSG